MRLRRLAIPTLLGLGVLAQVSSAGAQEQLGYAQNHFNPSERGSQWFAMDSLDLRGNGRLALGVVNDYSFRSLVKYGADGSTRASIVKDQFVSHLGGAVFLGDRVRIGFNVPLQLYANGRDTVINGITHRGADSGVAVGDLRIAADVRVFGEHTDALTVAAGAELFVPSGSLEAYTGDGRPRVLPRLLFAGRASSFVYGAKLGVMVRGRDEAFGEGQIGSALVGGVSAGLSFYDDQIVVGPEVFASTVLSNSRAFDTQTTPVEGILGAHFDLGNNLRAGIGGGTLFVRGYGAPVARGLLSFEWVPGDAKPAAPKPTKDRDGDGIADCDDACGFTPGVKSDSAETNGCPADSDQDGVPDNADACATVPGVRTPDAHTNGCPADADDDGIPDVEDSCPRQPGKRTDNPRSNGCPDLDNDGIIDLDDACPDVPGARSTDRKKNGCPADVDRDKDGVNDDVDACPDEAGKADPDPKKNGCPKAFLKAGTIEITEQVKFKTGSAELAGKESDELLAAVRAVLDSHTEIKKLRVEGHTDNKGEAAANKKLSQQRAETVAKWLTDHGIDKARLASAGFGSEKPIDSNDTEPGRTNNRRVEFHVEQGSAK